MNNSIFGQVRTQTFALSVVVLLVSLFRLPTIWNELLPVNMLALKVTHICAEPSMKGVAGQSDITNNNVQTAWLLGAAANCVDETEKAHIYWEMLLNQPNAHLPLLRAAEPQDVDLATVAVANQTDNALAYFWLGDGLLSQEDNSGAVDAYERALIILGENDADTWMKIGRLYEAEGDWQAAVHAYDLACEYWDKGKNGCPNAGRLYLDHGQYELALQRYQDSIKQLPNWPTALKGAVAALIALNQPGEAVPYLETLADNGDIEAAQMLEQINNSSN